MHAPCKISFARFTALFLLGLCSLTTSASARVNVVTLPGRDTVQLTIYNSADLTLVKETRVLTFRKGVNKLEFSWANTLIDPTSVEFRALSHADEVDVQDVSFPPRVTNTLEWRIKSDFSGEVKVEIRYFTSGIGWAADYVAEADKGEKLMQLAGSVRVTNNSGEDYDNAQVRLVVGVIRLVENISDLAKRDDEAKGSGRNAGRTMSRLSRSESLDEARKKQDGFKYAFGGVVLALDATAAKPMEMVKEALGEYFLYSVEGRDTIPTGWSKRLPSFQTPGIPLTSFCKFEAETWGEQVMRYYKFTNSVASKLGKEPLPDGAVKAFRRVTPDAFFAFVGDTAVKYIPIGEAVEMELGADTEVLVKPTLQNWAKTDLAFDNNGNVSGWTTRETWQIEIQNSRDIEVTLDLRRNFPGDWSLVTTAPHEKMDAHKVKFMRVLKAHSQEKITYELTTRLGTNATK